MLNSKRNAIWRSKPVTIKLSQTLIATALIVCAFWATSNVAMAQPPGYGDYIKPIFNEIKDHIPPPPCSSNDCDIPWNDASLYFDPSFYIAYRPDDATLINIGIREINYSYRINCDGILEVQILQIQFNWENEWTIIEHQIGNGVTPDISKIPIPILVNAAMRVILQRDNVNRFENIDDITRENKLVQTSLGSCWASIRYEVPPSPPSVFTKSMPNDIPGVLPTQYVYYSTPCPGVSCCSRTFDVSWDSDGNARLDGSSITSLDYNCNDYRATIKDANNNVIATNVECQPVCDWHNFSVPYYVGIIDEPVAFEITDKSLAITIIDNHNILDEVLLQVVDSYGNVYYKENTKIYNGLKIKTLPLPAGNYHFGIFEKNTKVFATGSFIITSEE